LYAAQTFNNNPDGRRLQIAWGRIGQPGMPFNNMMLFPNELTLRNTTDGVRLFCEPIEEIKLLHKKTHFKENASLDEVNNMLQGIDKDLLHLNLDIEMNTGFDFDILFRGNTILHYDGNFNRFNGAPYSFDLKQGFRFNIELLIDKTSIEGYIDNGRLFISEGKKEDRNKNGLEIKGSVKVHSVEVNELNSIWEN